MKLKGLVKKAVNGLLVAMTLFTFAVVAATPLVSLTQKEPVKTVQPITYSLPLLVSPGEARAGERIELSSYRCNNTGHDVDVTVSIFWQTADHLHLVPFLSPNPALGPGPSFNAIIPSGCASGSSSLVVPDNLWAGSWQLLGQVCYGGITIPGPETCASWFSDTFDVN